MIRPIHLKLECHKRLCKKKLAKCQLDLQANDPYLTDTSYRIYKTPCELTSETSLNTPPSSFDLFIRTRPLFHFRTITTMRFSAAALVIFACALAASAAPVAQNVSTEFLFRVERQTEYGCSPIVPEYCAQAPRLHCCSRASLLYAATSIFYFHSSSYPFDPYRTTADKTHTCDLMLGGGNLPDVLGLVYSK